MKLLLIIIGKLPHVTVFPAFNRFARGLLCSSSHLTQSKSGDGIGRIFCQFAAWFCGWIDRHRAERDGRQNEPCCFCTRIQLRGMPTPRESSRHRM
jgi:hypothetical protein